MPLTIEAPSSRYLASTEIKRGPPSSTPSNSRSSLGRAPTSAGACGGAIMMRGQVGTSGLRFSNSVS